MTKKTETVSWNRRRQVLLDAEKRIGPAPVPGPYPVALCYPNNYRAAMAGLGFQLVWDSTARHPAFKAERIFYSLSEKAPAEVEFPRSLETKSPLRSFETLFFSVQYELDYINFYQMLVAGNLNPRADDRQPGDPLVVVGGIAPTANPEPLAPFADVIYLGESEAAFGDVLDMLAWTRGAPKADRLAELRGIPGVYIPVLDREAPMPARPKALDNFPALSLVVTPYAGLGDTILVEPIRGCPRGCRFCLIGNAGGSVRVRRLAPLLDEVSKSADAAKKVSLIGSAISDYPDIAEFVNALAEERYLVSVSSLNLASVSEGLLTGIAGSGQRSVTFAPEAATERTRSAVGKPLPDGRLEEVLGKSVDAGLRSVKLYYLVGLPDEADEDAAAIGAEIAMLAVKFPMLRFEASVNPFVPKRWTPWACKPVAPAKVIRSRLEFIRKAIKGRAGLSATGPNEAAVQAFLSLGDRRAAEFIARRAESARPFARLTEGEHFLMEEFMRC
jgi:radical SAM superfamily enzyme YgiQ (UPF0313 family)